MKQIVLVIGAIYGMLSIILGAFGAHAFKNLLTPDKLDSFEVGVRYQMYHAIVLLIIGLLLNLETSIEKWTVWNIIIGTFLFSVSIYLLAFAEYWKINLKFLGPVTPLGGLFMIAGWALLIISFVKTRI